MPRRAVESPAAASSERPAAKAGIVAMAVRRFMVPIAHFYYQTRPGKPIVDDAHGNG